MRLQISKKQFFSKFGDCFWNKRGIFRRNILYYYFVFWRKLTEPRKRCVWPLVKFWLIALVDDDRHSTYFTKMEKEKTLDHSPYFLFFSPELLRPNSPLWVLHTNNTKQSSVLPPSLVILIFNLCIILAKFRTRISGYISQISLVDDDRQSTYFTKLKKKRKRKKQPWINRHTCFFFSGAPCSWLASLSPLHTTNTKQSSLIRHNWYLENVFCVFWRKFVLTRLSESLHTTNTKQSLVIRHNWYLKKLFCVFWRKSRPDSPLWVLHTTKPKTELGDPP